MFVTAQEVSRLQFKRTIEPASSHPAKRGLRVHLATIRGGGRSAQTIQRFRALAERDVVREHRLVDDPEEADVVLVVDLHAVERDVFPVPLRPKNLPRAWRGKVRVWDQRDNGYYTYPGLYVAPAPRLVKKHRQKAAPYISTIAPHWRSQQNLTCSSRLSGR